MKKLLTLAISATLLMAGSAFAQWGRHTVAQPNATFSFGGAGLGGLPGPAASPTTTNNDDSCDISVAPAATLLLPYFQVDTVNRSYDTFFTITNVSRLPQIAHVTIWTDWSYPVLDFNIWLTGYDVVPLSLYDIIVNGVIAPASLSTVTVPGTGTANANSPRGKVLNVTGTPYTSAANTANPNISATAGCDNLPGQYRSDIRVAVMSALVTGIYAGPTGGSFSGCGTVQVGSSSNHPNANTAIGYVTVDVSSVCSTTLPTTASYYYNEILFDNVLIGDYQILDKSSNAATSSFAGGNPMVHIRAIPEGGKAATPLTNGAAAVQQTNFPYSFYARYINGETISSTSATLYSAADGYLNYDRRQPLPSTFAARYIQGGTANMQTSYRIWREGVTGAETSGTNPTTCANAVLNSAMPMSELIRFDEHENANVFTTTRDVSPYLPPTATNLPETSTTPVTSSVFPPAFATGDTGGWMYMNLNYNGAYPSSAPETTHPDTSFNPALYAAGVRASQNWVVVTMLGGGAGGGALGVDFDAAWLGNGCTGVVPVSSISSSTGSTAYPGPAGGVLVCPAGSSCTGVTGYAGTNVTPLP
jgi:hypothetical protein